MNNQSYVISPLPDPRHIIDLLVPALRLRFAPVFAGNADVVKGSRTAV
ncbi:MAG: hypothetical protein ACYCWE_20390 [Eubacteriales bacterium]